MTNARHISTAIVLVALLAATVDTAPPSAFSDDFEHGLGGWDIAGVDYVRTIDSGDRHHGLVMELTPGGDVLALPKDAPVVRPGHGVRLEGDVLFPTDEDNYLGVAYNVQRAGDRSDFGVIYIKGNDGYLQANPRYDGNVGRTLYPEYRAPLRDASAITTGQWQRFAVEVIGQECHFYVGDMTTPQLTFPHFSGSAGRVGLEPRSVGGPVRVDNIRVTEITRLGYQGPARPRAFASQQGELIHQWQVIGPLPRTRDSIAQLPARQDWRPFETDRRGAVVSARVVDYHGNDAVAYFRTRISVPADTGGFLHFSSVDDLALWVNGHFAWFIPRGDMAWFDFWTNDTHKGQRIPVRLRQGDNDIVLRVRGGVYASGGFFARWQPAPASAGYDDMFPAWSPDGTRVVFTSTRDGDPEIYLADVGTGSLRRLTTAPGRDAHPAFSPDGTQIVFQSPRRGGATQIFTMNVDGSNQRPLTGNAGFCGMPVFSRDGSQLTFQCSDDAGKPGSTQAPWRIVVMAATGGPLRTVTHGPGNDQVANWTPDGRIVFYSNRGGSDQLYLLDLDNGAVTGVTSPPGVHRGGTFSPDGRHIAFMSNRDASPADVYVMNGDGSNRRRLTTTGPDHGVPFFSPDGKWILYQRVDNKRQRIWMTSIDGKAHRPLFR